MQISIPTLPEDSLCGLYGIPKVATLFSRVFDHGGIGSNDIINNWDAIGRIAKWAIELLPYEITYKPC